MAIKGGKKDTPSSATVAREKAEGRWEADLLDKVPDLYESALDRITPEMADMATEAELKRPGDGLPTLLAAMRDLEATPPQHVETVPELPAFLDRRKQEGAAA